MENKNQMKLIEVNGKSYKIDTKIYIPAGEMKEIIIACHGFAGDKESSAIEALADEMNYEAIFLFEEMAFRLDEMLDELDEED